MCRLFTHHSLNRGGLVFATPAILSSRGGLDNYLFLMASHIVGDEIHSGRHPRRTGHCYDEA